VTAGGKTLLSKKYTHTAPPEMICFSVEEPIPGPVSVDVQIDKED
jgi:hypothetical protein